MKKNMTRAMAAALLLSACLGSLAGCQEPTADSGVTTEGVTTSIVEITDTEKATEPTTTPVTAPATTPATEPVTDPVTEPETEIPFVGQTFDNTTRIVIPADADDKRRRRPLRGPQDHYRYNR